MYLELCAGSSGLCSMLKVCAIEEMLIVQVKKKTLFFLNRHCKLPREQFR